MPIVNRFCCFRLHTAGVLLGWLGAVASILNVITYSILVTRLDEIIKNYYTNDSSMTEASAKTMALTMISIYIALNAIDCVASILLIAGTIKERHLMIVPWLINSAISLTFNIINFVTSITLLIGNQAQFGLIVLVIVIAAIIIGIQMLAWLAIYSLFKTIQMSSETQRLIPKQSSSGIPSYTRI